MTSKQPELDFQSFTTLMDKLLFVSPANKDYVATSVDFLTNLIKLSVSAQTMNDSVVVINNLSDLISQL